MKQLSELFQSADWKQEKHVPVIELPEKAKKGENLKVRVGVGKQIGHPNTTEHHIAWIELYFHPEGEKFPYHIGKFTFMSHGSSVNGADTSSIYTHPEVTCIFKTEKNGTIYAASYCNIHGLWTNSEELKLV